MSNLPLFPHRFFEDIGLAWRRFDSDTGSLGRLGKLEVRLARSFDEVKRAQRLRYQVFYEEMAAVANRWALISRRDHDAYDRLCDHLLVLDHGGEEGEAFEPRIVGTYRLLRQEVAGRRGGFYSAGEFDVARMVARHPDRFFLELGRSCVLKPYRTKRTVELLWHGIWRYVRRHGSDVMVGCASLPGTDVAALAPLLAFMRRSAPAPEAWSVAALSGRGIAIDRLESEPAEAMREVRLLPPLIKGYLKLGAFVCEEAVTDSQFGTTDVFLVLPLEAISSRYIDHYGPEATRYA
jgi:putative hemolysin